jgi:hypothetical protein
VARPIRQLLVVILDDLHWVDQSSLDVFAHLVFTVAGRSAQEPIPLILAGAYRSPEPGSRLARLLLRLQREPLCHTIDLCPFDEIDIAAFIQGLDLGAPLPSTGIPAPTCDTWQPALSGGNPRSSATARSVGAARRRARGQSRVGIGTDAEPPRPRGAEQLATGRRGGPTFARSATGRLSLGPHAAGVGAPGAAGRGRDDRPHRLRGDPHDPRLG